MLRAPVPPPPHGSTPPLWSPPDDHIASARNEPLVGGGQLEITTKSGQLLPLLAYSATLAPQFSEVARGIEQLAKGEPLAIKTTWEQSRCPKCQRLLPEKDGVCPACVKRGKTMLRIARFLKPYKLKAATLALLSLLGTALALAPPKIQGILVDQVLKPQTNITLLFQLVALWAFVLLGGAAVQILNGRMIAWLAAHISADLRAALYRQIEMLKISYFDKKKVGSITSRITQDTMNVWSFLVEGVPFLVINLLLVTGVLAFLFATNWKLALAIFSPLPVVFLISSLFWGKMVRKWGRWSNKWAKFHSTLNESLNGIRVMKAFAQETAEQKKFTAVNDGIRHSGADADGYWNTIFGAMAFFIGLGAVIHWLVGGWMVVRGELTLGQFTMISGYLSMLYGPMQWFAAVNNWFSRAMAGAERVFEILDTAPEDYGNHQPPHEISGGVEFQTVRFGYDKSNPVIKGISFHAQPGEMIGLVGKSGSGKSTTINLICRFYEPDAGTIRIDGKDYRHIALQDLRKQIGVVLQEPFLFNGSIRDNIAYGKPGASFPEIVEAAKAANAHEFILGKPDSYDTLVGERGSKLSGGERQRISIARAILHNPRILILDEATSSVDVETEKQIQEAIARLIKNRTTFAIAHRLSTLRNANRLIVLEKGEIAEIGTHAELMAKQGTFAKLVQMQTATNEIIAVGT